MRLCLHIGVGCGEVNILQALVEESVEPITGGWTTTSGDPCATPGVRKRVM